MAVDHVVVHHQGGGKPNKNWTDRHYSLVVGDGTWTINHGPAQDTSTAGLNGQVFGVCFRGQRHKANWWSVAYKISDDDLVQLRAGMAEARRRGYVSDLPHVDFHGDPALQPLGNATVCPGNLTYARRTDVEVACQLPGQDWGPVIDRLGVLQPGDENDRVKYLQGLLNVIFPKAGFKMSGRYGPKTVKYVRQVRQLAGLDVSNGGTGPKVWAALLFFAGTKA